MVGGRGERGGLVGGSEVDVEAESVVVGRRRVLRG